MEAYLDWRLPNWREQVSAEDWQPRGSAEREQAEAPRSRARPNRMSVEEAYAVLGVEKTASDEEIKQGMDPHLCRCGTHFRIMRAVRQAVNVMSPGSST